MRTDDLDDALRALDPAPPSPDVRSPRADADLRRILATSRSRPAAVSPRTRRRPLRTGLVAVVAAGALVVAGGAALDVLRPTTASATWTSAGEAVGADAPGVLQCATWWQVQSADLRPVLQEQRGDTTLVLASDGAGGELLCTATLVAGQEPIGGMTSIEDTTTAVPPPDGAIVVRVNTTFSEAMVQNGWRAHGHTAVTGHVGPEVTGLTLQTRAGPVEASLAEGRFAAWWPIEDDSDPHPAVVATLSLADGTSREVTLREAG